MIFVADTHALIWLIDGDRRLSAAVKAIFLDHEQRIHISTLSLVEIEYAFMRGKSTENIDETLALIDRSNNVVIHPLTLEIAKLMPSGVNVHDAVIVATALHLQELYEEPVQLITRDSEVAKGGLIDVIW